MGAGNGFQTTAPDTRYTTNAPVFYASESILQKFTCGGSGTQEISEIGFWTESLAAGACRFAIFTDDAGNGCPETIVTNSGTSEYALTGGVQKVVHTYSTKPQVTGGSPYWLAVWIGPDNNTYADAIATGGTSIQGGGTYPTWPDGDTWHTGHNDKTFDTSLYAVYASSATSQFVRQASDVAPGLLQFDRTGHKFLG